MKLTTLLLTATLALAPTAWAGNCPNLVKEIDAMLESNPDLASVVDEESGKTVKELRDEGEKLHENGQHAESVETLDRALALVEE